MSKISRPDLTTDFTTFFFSAGENPNPVELSEEVLFTFPYAAPTIELRFPRFQAVSGVVGATAATFGIVPADRYQIVHSVEMQHSDGAGPHLARISLVNSEVGANLVAFATHDSLTFKGRLFVRSLVVPPKWRIQMDLDSIAAGANIIGRQLFTEHNLAQPLMGLTA